MPRCTLAYSDEMLYVEEMIGGINTHMLAEEVRMRRTRERETLGSCHAILASFVIQLT